MSSAFEQGGKNKDRRPEGNMDAIKGRVLRFFPNGRRKFKKVVDGKFAGIENIVKDLAKRTTLIRSRLEFLIRDRYVARYPSLAKRNFFDAASDEPGGIVLELLHQAGAEKFTFVDIGCGRSGGNSILLASAFGWSGLMVDASEEAVVRVGEVLCNNTGVKTLQEFVTPENINEIIIQAGFRDPDLFSLDIDSYDYWVYEAFNMQPRVVVLEYNALLGKESVTVPSGQRLQDTPKGYHGASLAALTSSAKRKGYRLVGVDYLGTNAFFVRDDLAPAIPSVSAEVAWRALLNRKAGDGKTRDSDEAIRRIQQAGLPLQHVN